MKWFGALAVAALFGCATSTPSPGGVEPRDPNDPSASNDVQGASDARGGGKPRTAKPLRLERPSALEAVPRTPPPVRQARLQNGLKVVVLERPGRPVVALRLLFGRGAASDPTDARGSTYFAVAMLGDRRERNYEEIRYERSFQRMVTDKGGEYFFNVTADDSMIGIEGYAQDAKAYLEMLAEAVKAPRQGEVSFIWRREAIRDGLGELETGDPQIFYDTLGRAAFGANHAYSRSPYGDRSSLESLEIKPVIAQQEMVLSPGDSTLLIVGDVKADDVLSEVAGRFGPWTARRKVAVKPVAPPPVVKRTSIALVPRSPARTMATCGVRGLSDLPKDSEAAVEVLAGVAAKRLSDALRERLGMTYGVSANILRHRSARAFLVCTRLLPDATTDGLKFFRDTLAAMREGPANEAEVARVKATLAGDLDAAADSLNGLLGLWTRHFAQGEPLATAERIKALEGVTAARVRELGKQVLATDSLQIVLSGEQKVAMDAVHANGLGKLDVIRMTR